MLTNKRTSKYGRSIIVTIINITNNMPETVTNLEFDASKLANITF